MASDVIRAIARAALPLLFLLGVTAPRLDARGGVFDQIARGLAPQLDSLEQRRQQVAEALERRFHTPPPGWGFHSQPQPRAAGEFKIDIVLERPRDIEQLAVAPAKAKSFLQPGDEPGYGFPRQFSVEVSPNEREGPFRTVWEWSAEQQQAGVRPELATAIDERNVRTIRFISHEHYAGKYEGAEFFVVALAEFAAFSKGLNVCLGARVSSDGHVQTEHWDDAFLVDGYELSMRVAKREGPLGYRSTLASSSEAERDLKLDLGDEATLGEMRLYPAILPDPALPEDAPYCLPRRIWVEFANDKEFSNIHELALKDAAAVTREDREAGVFSLFSNAATSIQLPPIQARFVRVRMSMLRPAPCTTRSKCVSEAYYAALAEFELLDAFGKNVALNATAHASPAADPTDLTTHPSLAVDGDSGAYVYAGSHSEPPQPLGLADLGNLLNETATVQANSYARLVLIVIVACVCFGVAITGGLVWRFRAKRESFASRRFESVRQQIANDLHDDVGGNLGAIRMLSQAVAEAAPGEPETQEDLRRISQLASETANMMRDIVWLIDGSASTLQELLQRMELVSESLLAGMEHTIEVRCEAKNPHRKLPAEFRRHILLALKETLNNTVRHSGADHVSVLIWANDRALQFRVADNGKGMQRNGNGGRGLKSLHDRAKALKGELKIETQPGQGVTVDFQAKDLA